MENRDDSLFRPYLSLCIILRPRESSEYERLADMVQEVNDTAVRKEERLSYHVYVYSRDEDTLLIAA